MKRSLNSLIGYTLGASDGEIGKVKEFYFDDKTWTIRYLVVETGTWLLGREVLIAAEMLLKPNWEKSIFPVNLTKEQIRNSPDIDTQKPVSRQEEIKLQDYYMRTSYMGSGGYEGAIPAYMQQVLTKDEKKLPDKTSGTNAHLRSTCNVTGYYIEATDGEIGDVVDFIVDDNTWEIDFIVVDTGNWLPGKKVLIAPKWIQEIDWEAAEVIVHASIKQVKGSPEYDSAQPVSEDHKVHLHNYYSQFVTNIE